MIQTPPETADEMEWMRYLPYSGDKADEWMNEELWDLSLSLLSLYLNGRGK